MGTEEGRTYTEENWADYAVKEVEEKGAEAEGITIYTASKVLAEKGASRLRFMRPSQSSDRQSRSGPIAAWKLQEDNKDRIAWDISVVCPGWVFGVSLSMDLRG